MTNRGNRDKVLSIRFTSGEYALLVSGKPSGVDISKHCRSVLLHSVLKSADKALDDLKTSVPFISSRPSKNQSCFCGSGKKYKKCCMLKGA
ncbi:MAG: hypothetical protein DDT22_01229 [candidate division WS2 bacterium]|nr:hypothetical protein [Candidatus Lithacetigena glycinireducens]